jgi:thioredoxin 1
MRTFFVVITLIASLALAGCESKSSAQMAPVSIPELQQAIGAGGKPTLVFFLNPQGGPCQQQNGILQQVYQERGGNFNVAYVNALKPEHQKAFYDYGVRNLPSMVLVDSAGRIAKVFAPGIQSSEIVAAALNATK